MATLLPMMGCSARYTDPIPPRPRSFWTLEAPHDGADQRIGGGPFRRPFFRLVARPSDDLLRRPELSRNRAATRRGRRTGRRPRPFCSLDAPRGGCFNGGDSHGRTQEHDGPGPAGARPQGARPRTLEAQDEDRAHRGAPVGGAQGRGRSREGRQPGRRWRPGGRRAPPGSWSRRCAASARRRRGARAQARGQVGLEGGAQKAEKRSRKGRPAQQRGAAAARAARRCGARRRRSRQGRRAGACATRCGEPRAGSGGLHGGARGRRGRAARRPTRR